jgi:hypothetical protein
VFVGRLVRLTGWVSLDYAVIPARFSTVDEALRTCEAMYGPPMGDPPAEVLDLIEELDPIDAIDERHGFLSMWPVDASALGAILCTSYHEWARTTYTLLDMTKDRGLALVDLQLRQVFDPRGRVDADVNTANGTRLPYLTEEIARDVMDGQDRYGDFMIVKRAEGTFIQALYERGAQCCIEYRAGGPDRHFRTLIPDRTLVPRLIWAWLQNGPHAGLLQAQRWQRLEF